MINGTVRHGCVSAIVVTKLCFFGDKNSDYSTMCYTYEGFRDFLSYVNVIEMNHLVDTPPAVAKDSNVIDFQAVIAHKSGAGN